MGPFAKFPGNQNEFEERIPWTLLKDANAKF